MGNAGLRIAKVVATHPEGYAVDLVFLDTNARSPWVQVLSWSASTNTGAMDLPAPTEPEKPYDVQESNDRDIYAVVGFVAGVPVVLGFLYPQVCQMLFADQNRKIERHASDWYTSVDGEGNFEASHPSGTYLRIGKTPEHEDLTGKDFDRKWAIAKNTDAAVHVHLTVKNAGVEKASIDIGPEGDVALVHAGNLSVQTAGDASIEVGGNLATSAATWAHSGDVTITGTMTVTEDVIGSGKSLKAHTHGGVVRGGALSDPPS